MCEKFHYDRLRNDRALGNVKSDNNKNNNNNNNVGSVWGPVSGYKKQQNIIIFNSSFKLIWITQLLEYDTTTRTAFWILMSMNKVYSLPKPHIKPFYRLPSTETENSTIQCSSKHPQIFPGYGPLPPISLLAWYECVSAGVDSLLFLTEISDSVERATACARASRYGKMLA